MRRVTGADFAARTIMSPRETSTLSSSNNVTDPVLTRQPLTLAALVEYPVITYAQLLPAVRASIGHSNGKACSPTAIDSDVIKTYVELGRGAGIIAEMVFDSLRDEALAAMPATNLFEGNTTRLAFRRDIWLRGYEYDFMELLALHLTRRVVEVTQKGKGADPGL